MMPSDYMVFADFIYEGDKYRAVTFSKYRPYVTGYTSSASNTDQDDNGYTVDNVYYFKYEPLRWRVLDAGEGLVMSENIIDSQAFQNYVLYASSKYWGDSDKTYYASNWANSSIRQWLNNDFKNTAFNASQQKKIVPVTLDNSSQLDSTYNSASTTDKVFLLSYSEVKNTRYGFASSALTNDINRRAHSTDYAKCQGCRTETHSPYLTADGEDTSYWRLRSPYYSYYYTNEVDNSGYANNYSSVDGTGIGVRPALRLAPSANSKSSAPSKKAPAKSAVGTEAKTMYSNYSSGIAGNDYILLNVTGYGEGFTLTSENLLYIDQLTADSSGSLEIKFTPKYNDPDSTTLLIGDFGSGVETKILTVSEVKKYSVTWIIDGVQTVEYLAKGEPIYAPMAPEKEGYTFVGWTPGMPKSMPGMDLTFTAVYEKDPEPQGSVKGVKLDDISLNYLGKATLKPQITADEGVKYTVKYESSNPKVATVDDNGNVTATKKGTAEIRVTVTDENNNTVTNTCKVTVKYSGLQWFIIIVLFGWIWYLK
ncbi:MAG: Ig-like domain-containing protein [Clostridia bacterium]|nr:Ig-like domain-containing protein [Clostridia bacterium]